MTTQARNGRVASSLHVKVGFNQWREVAPANVAEINDDIDRMFISPDVHSLHIVYGFKGGEEWYHEIKDYPYDDVFMPNTDIEEMFKAWLKDEVGFDWWEVGFGEAITMVYDELGQDEDPKQVTLW